jgi:carboxyl-terminal processing protease
MKLGSALAFLLGLAGQAAAQDPGRAVWLARSEGEPRKVKAYLKEVKKHLLESYIDREKLTEEKLVAAALRAMAAAMNHKDFAGLSGSQKGAVREAVLESETIDAALDRIARGEPQVDLLKLSDHAASAMVQATGDPYSRILTDTDMSKLLKMLQGGGRDDSAGLAIHLFEGQASVFYIQYGYPAYEAGLEIGDRVLEIRGRKPATILPEELPELLSLALGDVLELKILRNNREYVFKLRPRAFAVKDVRFQYLGHGVGYLRLTLFDNALVKETRNALKEMARLGMRGLILDLRHNPGGVLTAATGVADLLLPPGLLITRTVSHYRPSIGGFSLPGLGGDAEYRSHTPGDFKELPMVCLINGASASASELLAGALKDHERAILIGERTYGKGVGQSPILLSSMFLKRYLYLTVLRYTTPKGRTVDHEGISPQVLYAEERPSAEAFDALWKIRESGIPKTYVDQHWGGPLRQLAERDGFDSSRYPGFEEFFQSQKSGLTRDQIREEIRRAARGRLADEGTIWVSDLETDRVLQRGLVEMLDLLEKRK